MDERLGILLEEKKQEIMRVLRGRPEIVLGQTHRSEGLGELQRTRRSNETGGADEGAPETAAPLNQQAS